MQQVKNTIHITLMADKLFSNVPRQMKVAEESPSFDEVRCYTACRSSVLCVWCSSLAALDSLLKDDLLLDNKGSRVHCNAREH